MSLPDDSTYRSAPYPIYTPGEGNDWSYTWLDAIEMRLVE
jgi:hypothetical protein